MEDIKSLAEKYGYSKWEPPTYVIPDHEQVERIRCVLSSAKHRCVLFPVLPECCTALDIELVFDDSGRVVGYAKDGVFYTTSPICVTYTYDGVYWIPDYPSFPKFYEVDKTLVEITDGED